MASPTKDSAKHPDYGFAVSFRPTPWNISDTPDVAARLAKLRRQTELAPLHYESLNIRLEEKVGFDNLIPRLQSGLSPIPPQSWLDPASLPETPARRSSRMFDDCPDPNSRVFRDRIKELRVSNADAFRIVAPSIFVTADRPSTQITHFRRFFENLELLSDEGQASKPLLPVKDPLSELLKVIAWAFKLQYRVPRASTVLQVSNVRIPVYITGVSWAVPREREKARSGWFEGPVMGCLAREFKEGSNDDVQDSVVDLLKEVSALLVLAQERAREGKVERAPGEGEWWTTKPRWGGGEGGEVGKLAEDIGMDEDGQSSGGSNTKSYASAASVGQRKAAREKAVLKMVKQWKCVKTGSKIWDPKVDYKATGKDSDSAWDDVFLLSGHGHHAALVRLTLHRAYLELLRTGKAPSTRPAEEDWSMPVLRRSDCFDLLVPEERVEIARGLWGALRWLTRTGEG